MTPEQLMIYEKEIRCRVVNVLDHEIMDKIHDVLDDDLRAGKITEEEAETLLTRASLLFHPNGWR